MKKTISLILAVMLTVIFSAAAFAAEITSAATELNITMQIGNPNMTINGQEQEIDPGRGTVPQIIDGRTMVPIRAVIEAMGGNVEWLEDENTAVLTYNSDIIRLTINSTKAYLNDEENTLDVAPQIINERTMLPIRFIAEGFKFYVDWDGETQTVIIKKTMNTDESTAVKPTDDTGKKIVVYYSATGNTENVANIIANAIDADTFEIEPAEPYTSDDLDWTDKESRVSREYENEALREMELVSTEVQDWESYDTVFIGYPIWWGVAAWPTDNFVKAVDFTGKTVIPFCTSSSSALGDSADILHGYNNTGNWIEGRRFRSGTSENDVLTWFTELGLK